MFIRLVLMKNPLFSQAFLCNWKIKCYGIIGVGGNQIQFGSLNIDKYLWKGFLKVTFIFIASFFNNLLFRLMFNLVCKQSTEKILCIFFLKLKKKKKIKNYENCKRFNFTFYFAFGYLYKKRNIKQHKKQ